jgi:hypothetical protein
MEKTAVNSDSEVETILKEAYNNAIRKSDEYQFGRIEERMDAEKEFYQKSFDKVVPLAESFFSIIKSNNPNLSISQFRIGADCSSGMPSVLLILRPDQADKVTDLRSLARHLERVACQKSICIGSLWTMLDANLDQDQIEMDFPFYRKEL